MHQELACALRILAREGWRENLSGHITVATDDGGMWCNPWGIWWEEVQASDILRLDADGEIVEGVGRHARRSSCTPSCTGPAPTPRSIVHNHPYYATLLATMGEHAASWCTRTRASSTASSRSSTSTAASRTPNDGKWLATQVGDASGILLAHHGAIVTAPTIAEACYKATTFERMCRFTYDTLAAGRDADGDPGRRARASLKPLLRQNTPQAYWDGAVRLLLRDEPEVLT